MNLKDVIGWFSLLRITYAKTPEEAAALGYRNPGTDRRLAGEIGKLAGHIQASLSYKSLDKPVYLPVEQHGNIFIQHSYDPGKPNNRHIAMAIRRSDGRWDTLRFGYRYDPNWGDANTIGGNPDPEIIGGYIFDVVLKLNSDRPFIGGVQ